MDEIDQSSKFGYVQFGIREVLLFVVANKFVCNCKCIYFHYAIASITQLLPPTRSEATLEEIA